MYRDYYSLNIKPFQITADPKFLWLGEKHKEALATLQYGILDNRGFLLLTGEVGTGKTVLINSLINYLDENTLVAKLLDPDLKGMDFYNALADEFKMDRTFKSKGQFLIHFRKFLIQSYSLGQKVLLIIDESQRLGQKLIEDIRILSNIELQDRKLINIFFVGQQEFNNTLMTPQNRALSQRITVRYHIDALDEDETGEYIRHRLKIAGTQKKIFKKSAIRQIFNSSHGLPRLINIICDHALLTAYTRNLPLVEGKIIAECVKELRIHSHTPKAKAGSFRGSGKHPDGDASGQRRVGNASSPHDAEMNAAGRRSHHPAEPFSFRWSRWLSNLAAILLIIGVTTYFIDRYAGTSSIVRYAINPSARVNNSDLNLQNNKSTPEMEKAEPEDGATGGQLQPSQVRTNGDTEPGAADKRESLSLRPDPQATPDPKLNAQDTGNAMAAAIAEVPDSVKPPPLTQDKILVQFSISSNEIDAVSYPVLDKIAAYLTYYPEAAINVRGYTDNRGPESYNESMSFFRANVVKSYLIGKGVYPERIVVYAMGGANPIASNASLYGRRQNRRVEIELQ